MTTSLPDISAGVTATLLALIRDLLAAPGMSGQVSPAPTLDSHLEQDLGLDSLGRTELFARVQREFGVHLPDRALLAETPRELLQAVLGVADGAALSLAVLPAAVAGLGAAETVGEPAGAGTLVEALAWHVQHHRQRVHIHLYGDADEPQPFSYADLWQGALALAGGLLARGVAPGDRVALMLPSGRGYFFSFFGILLAGGVPVPIYPPTRPSQLEEHLLRHAGILRNAGSRLLITVPEARLVAHLLRARSGTLRHLVTPEELARSTPLAAPAARGAMDLAFLQYTSGSTGDPKGVMLTHADLLANIRAMGRAAQIAPADLFVSWLPLYHDMGLIGAWLGSLYYGVPLVILSPLRFLARPSRWLWAIHRHRGTLSAAPNFAYELCVSRIPPEELSGLDLSCWRWAFNGAEPVSAATMRRFAVRFAPYGLDPRALAPVYGLAEAAVGLAFPPSGRGLQVDWVRRDLLARTGEALPVAEADPQAQAVVACGRPLPGYRVRLVDAAGRELPARREGRLQFQGPSATSGYFANPAASVRLRDGDWLDTGDRAYQADGDLYITGRTKELIIRGGRNLYPYELEAALGELPGIRRGCVAVFPASDAASGTERLVVVAETRERDPVAREQLQRAVRECGSDLLGTPPDAILLVPPHRVLKTSSGKIRRAALRDLYERGLLTRRPRPLWWQASRVAAAALTERLGGACRRVGEGLFAGWAGLLFGLLVPPVWLAVLLLPQLPWRWVAIRTAVRVLRALAGVPLRVAGNEHLPPAGQAWVLVANHQSYLDTLALIAALPRDFVYVAKAELQAHRFSRLFLERLDTLFVERFDTRRSAAAGQRLLPVLARGRPLALYPEGTFRAEPGLLPFRMGAFVTAARVGVPLLPVSIAGTRGVLRSGTWWPRHGAIQVTLHPPLIPEGSDWTAALQLRAAARTAILAGCGEPDLAGERAIPRPPVRSG